MAAWADALAHLIPAMAIRGPFLGSVRAELTPSDCAVFNPFRDGTGGRRVARPQTVFRAVRSVPVSGNLVLHYWR